MTRTRIRFLTFVFPAFLMFTVVAVYTAQYKEIVIRTPEADARAGATFDAAIAKTPYLLPDPILEKYVTKVGERMVAVSPGWRWKKYAFRVVGIKKFHAFSCPGGYVYVSVGVLEQIKSEDELAAVLAHEIVHTNLRHGPLTYLPDLSRYYPASVIYEYMRHLIGSGGFLSDLIQNPIARRREESADAPVVWMLARAGYDPQEFITVLKRLDAPIFQLPDIFRTHPSGARRIEKAEQQLLLYPPLRKTQAEDFLRIKKHVEKTYGHIK